MSDRHPTARQILDQQFLGRLAQQDINKADILDHGKLLVVGDVLQQNRLLAGERDALRASDALLRDEMSALRDERAKLQNDNAALAAENAALKKGPPPKP
jgi:hypothetical protein